MGTNFGSVIVISLTMPDNYDNRVLCLQTVLATPTRKLALLFFKQQLKLNKKHLSSHLIFFL